VRPPLAKCRRLRRLPQPKPAHGIAPLSPG